jgi:hypothetical protein
MKERSAILTFAGGHQRQGEYKSEKQGDVVCSEHIVFEFTAPNDLSWRNIAIALIDPAFSSMSDNGF